jgi:PAS domain S-box-containing protein
MQRSFRLRFAIWDRQIKNMSYPGKTTKAKCENALAHETYRFSDLFMNVPSSIAILKGDEHEFCLVNHSFRQIVGNKDILGKKAKDALPELAAQGIIDVMDKAYKSGSESARKRVLVRLSKVRNAIFKHLWIDILCQPFRDKEGRIEGVVFLGDDQTALVHAGNRIELLERQIHKIAETVQEGIWILDGDNRTAFVNSKMTSVLGYNADELMGETVGRFANLKTEESIGWNFGCGKLNGPAVFEDRFVNKSGKQVPVLVSASPLFNGEGQLTGTLAAVTDLTEKRKVERISKLQKSRKKREITRAVLSAQEKERNFLASELHDNINQILLGTKLQLQTWLQSPTTDTQLVQSSYKQLCIAVEEIRKISANRITRRFGEHLFSEAILSLCNSLSIRKIIKADLSNLKEDLINQNIKLAIYRIIQEHLSNVIKYANASEVYINICTDNRKLVLLIWDNGVGFNARRISLGTGITNIFNRAESLKGKARIKSSRGKGCKLELSIPILSTELAL